MEVVCKVACGWRCQYISTYMHIYIFIYIIVIETEGIHVTRRNTFITEPLVSILFITYLYKNQYMNDDNNWMYNGCGWNWYNYMNMQMGWSLSDWPDYSKTWQLICADEIDVWYILFGFSWSTRVCHLPKYCLLSTHHLTLMCTKN